MPTQADRLAADLRIAAKIQRNDATVSLDVIEVYGTALKGKLARGLPQHDAEVLFDRVIEEAVAGYDQEKGRFGTFLFLVGKRRYIDAVRRRSSTPRLRAGDTDSGNDGISSDYVARLCATEETCSRLDAIHAAFATLTPAEREAVRRKYMPDRPPDPNVEERPDDLWRRLRSSGMAKIRKAVLAGTGDEAKGTDREKPAQRG